MINSCIKYLKGVVGNMLIGLTCYLAEHAPNSIFASVLYGIHKMIVSIFGLSVLPILPFAVYLDGHKDTKRTLVCSNRKGVCVKSTTPFVQYDTPQWRDLPDIYLTVFKDVVFSGDSDVIVSLAEHCIISDFYFNLSDNVLCSDSLLYREQNNWALVRKNFKKIPIVIESGIMLSGKFSRNYYHNLFENLNRALLLDELDISLSVPLLVDSVVMKMPTLLEALSIMTKGSKREIIQLDADNLYECNNLYYIDHLHYLIPHHKNQQMSCNEISLYDPNLLKRQRDILLSCKLKQDTPRRIFVSRANSKARQFNETAIYDIVKGYGFEMVFPEKLSFREQMSLFHNAECIVGGSGAAFSNILFCCPGCKVICFRAVKGDIGSSVFKTIAWANNVDFWHYSPDRVVKKNNIHSNYYIDPLKFGMFIRKILDE